MEIKAGDVVSLKSGSLKMKVEDIGNYGLSEENQAKCVWFDSVKKGGASFHYFLLRKF